MGDVVHWLSPPPLPALAELIYPEGVLPATVLITLDDIRRAWFPAALVGRFAETDRFAIPEVDVDLDVLDFSSSFFQATISFQIALKKQRMHRCFGIEGCMPSVIV